MKGNPELCSLCSGAVLTNLFVLPDVLYQQVTGHLDDCTCDVETIDAFNNYKLFPRLNQLLESDYFRYYKVSFPYKKYVNICQ